MRELFDEVAGQSPLDPEEAVRRATRAPQRKRFYTNAGVVEADGGFAVTLDGKPIRTPSGREVVVPNARHRGRDRGRMERAGRDHRSPDHAADALCQQRRRGGGRSRRRCRRRRREISRLGFVVLSRRPSRSAGRQGSRALGPDPVSGRRTSSARISSSPRASCMSPSRSRRSRRRARRSPPTPGRSRRCMW